MAPTEQYATKVQQSTSDSLDLNIYLEMHYSVSNCLRSKTIRETITPPLTLTYNVENQKPKEKSEKKKNLFPPCLTPRAKDGEYK